VRQQVEEAEPVDCLHGNQPYSLGDWHFLTKFPKRSGEMPCSARRLQKWEVHERVRDPTNTLVTNLPSRVCPAHLSFLLFLLFVGGQA
jgi:hypothetical protein